MDLVGLREKWIHSWEDVKYLTLKCSSTVTSNILILVTHKWNKEEGRIASESSIWVAKTTVKWCDSCVW